MNECNVKVSRCNTTWSEMVALHVAVADALHAAAAAEPSSPAPLICGPTAAFPEYQSKGFHGWRPGGMFHDFVTGAGGSMDCFSVHLYSTFHSDPHWNEPPDPYTANFSTHSGSNLLATLDLQEVATAALRPGPGAGSPMCPRPRPRGDFVRGARPPRLPAGPSW